MGLPWTRLDSNIASHDKILRLVTEYKHGKGSAFVYVCSLGYAAGNGTDGLVPFACLHFIHATKRDAEALVEVGLWHPHPCEKCSGPRLVTEGLTPSGTSGKELLTW